MQYKLDEVRFLGQKVSSAGVEPDLKNIEAIKAIETPTNRNELLRILGLLKFFVRYISNFSEKTKNMRHLTKNNVNFCWSKEHEQELVQLKSEISQSPALAIFDPQKEIIVQCDASSCGLGACIYQSKPVAYASRSLTDTEKKYAQLRKNCLA